MWLTRHLDPFYAHARTARVAELSRLDRTVNRREPEILIFFGAHTSNAGAPASTFIQQRGCG